jgi:GTP-binding protein
MADSNFVDYIRIFCRSGKGGAGSAHLRTEKFIAKGGPDGGDGGQGGHVILRGNTQLWTLLHLRYRKHIFAGHAENGSKKGSTGKDGEDVIIEVPLGTVAREADSGEVLFEITTEGEEHILVKGGRGGLGNTHFKSATNQTPRYAQPGEPFIEGWYSLELKILADVGLVGFPNAGKSTLLSVISAAKPKIADYPFTTLVPNLGIVEYRDSRSFVILLFMIPADSKSISGEYNILLNELKEFNPELLDKKRVLAITKSDLADDELMKEMKKELPRIPSVFISSHSNLNLLKLKDILWKELNS